MASHPTRPFAEQLRRHPIPGVGSVVGAHGWDGEHQLTPGVGAISCPTPTTCVALGRAGGIARTTDGGTTWSVRRLPRPSPLIAIACPSASVCYAGGKMGRLMCSRDGGVTWRDLVPAIFFSGTYSAKPQLHTYSPWFAATGPWQVTVGVYPEAYFCSVTDVSMFVQDTARKRVAGPIRAPPSSAGFVGEFGAPAVRVTGRLRLDVVSPHCTEFSVRIDRVQRAPLTSVARRLEGELVHRDDGTRRISGKRRRPSLFGPALSGTRTGRRVGVSHSWSASHGQDVRGLPIRGGAAAPCRNGLPTPRIESIHRTGSGPPGRADQGEDGPGWTESVIAEGFALSVPTEGGCHGSL